MAPRSRIVPTARIVRMHRHASAIFAAVLLLSCASAIAGCATGSGDAGNGAVYDAWRSERWK